MFAGSWDLCRLIVTQKESTHEPKTQPHSAIILRVFSEADTPHRAMLGFGPCSQGTTWTLWDKSGQLSWLEKPGMWLPRGLIMPDPVPFLFKVAFWKAWEGWKKGVTRWSAKRMRRAAEAMSQSGSTLHRQEMPGHARRAWWEEAGRREATYVFLHPFRKALLASRSRTGLSFSTGPGLQHDQARYRPTMSP